MFGTFVIKLQLSFSWKWHSEDCYGKLSDEKDSLHAEWMPSSISSVLTFFLLTQVVMGCDSSPSGNCLLTTQQWFPLSAFPACPWQGLNAEQSPGEKWSGPYLGTADVCRDSQLFLTFLLVFHLWDACENITVRARCDQGLQLHWRWTLPILLTRHEVLETAVPKITIHQESILSWATSDAWRGTN